MTIKNTEIEWFDDKFDCNEPTSNLSILFHDFAMPNEEEPKCRILFILDAFDKEIQEYQYVMLGFNRELNIMAIKPVEFRMPGAYKMYSVSEIWTLVGLFPSWPDSPVVLVTPEDFLIEFGLNHSEATNYEAEFDEEKQLLLVAIDKDNLVKSSTSSLQE